MSTPPDRSQASQARSWFQFRNLGAFLALVIGLTTSAEMYGTQEPVLVRWEGGRDIVVEGNFLDPLRYERVATGVEAARLDLQLFDFVKAVLEGEITSRDGQVLRKPIGEYRIRTSQSGPVLSIALDSSFTETDVLAVFWTMVSKSIEADPTTRPRMILRLSSEQTTIKEQLKTEQDDERRSVLTRLLDAITSKLNSLLIM